MNNELNVTATELIATWHDQHQYRAYLADRPGEGTYLITTINQTPDGEPNNGFEAVAETLLRAPEYDDPDRWAEFIVTDDLGIFSGTKEAFAFIRGKAYRLEFADVVLASIEWPEDPDDIGTLHDATIEPDAEREALSAVREALTGTLGMVLDIEDLDEVAPRLLAALRAEFGGYLIDPAIVGVAYVTRDGDAERTREVYLNLAEPMADNLRFQSYDGAEWSVLA